MPELPDLAVFQQYFESTSLHQAIQRVRCHEPNLLVGTSPGGVGRWLSGHSFSGTDRIGKNFFAEMDDGRFLRFHFGMTGYFEYFKGLDEEPEYSQFRIHFDNGYHLALVMPRKLGEIQPLESMEDYAAEAELGPDVFKDSFGFSQFKDILVDRRAMIKSSMMDQSVMAGLGNVYNDEILYQARIHPRAQIPDLSEKELGKIYHAMRRVINKAIEVDAQPERMPENWLLPHREPGAQCPRCRGEIERIDVSGRTGYYCPSCQKMPD
ncbi:MAG: Fpg/Nei family DNA glycosylase [Anaerolineales bacterium]